MIEAIVLVLFTYAVIFFCFGPLLVRKLDTVQRFDRIRRSLENWRVDLTPIPSPVELASFCNTEFKQTSRLTVVGGVDLKHRPMGDLVDIVHFRNRAFKSTLHELRVYAFILVALGGLGYLKFLEENGFQADGVKFFHWMHSHPLEMVAILEAVMVAALSFKLLAEIRTISELLNP